MLMSIAKSGEPNQTPRYAAYDQVLHCLPMSHKKDSSLQLVNTIAIWGSRPTKAQTSLCMCAVCSTPLLFAYWKVSYTEFHSKRNSSDN